MSDPATSQFRVLGGYCSLFGARGCWPRFTLRRWSTPRLLSQSRQTRGVEYPSSHGDDLAIAAQPDGADAWHCGRDDHCVQWIVSSGEVAAGCQFTLTIAPGLAITSAPSLPDWDGRSAMLGRAPSCRRQAAIPLGPSLPDTHITARRMMAPVTAPACYQKQASYRPSLRRSGPKKVERPRMPFEQATRRMRLLEGSVQPGGDRRAWQPPKGYLPDCMTSSTCPTMAEAGLEPDEDESWL